MKISEFITPAKLLDVAMAAKNEIPEIEEIQREVSIQYSPTAVAIAAFLVTHCDVKNPTVAIAKAVLVTLELVECVMRRESSPQASKSPRVGMRLTDILSSEDLLSIRHSGETGDFSEKDQTRCVNMTNHYTEMADDLIRCIMAHYINPEDDTTVVDVNKMLFATIMTTLSTVDIALESKFGVEL